jgi:hypothetical protein
MAGTDNWYNARRNILRYPVQDLILDQVFFPSQGKILFCSTLGVVNKTLQANVANISAAFSKSHGLKFGHWGWAGGKCGGGIQKHLPTAAP